VAIETGYAGLGVFGGQGVPGLPTQGPGGDNAQRKQKANRGCANTPHEQTSVESYGICDFCILDYLGQADIYN
jgi:hypothetical protein